MQWQTPIDQRTLARVVDLDRFNGRWQADKGVPPTRLTALREAARIQSVAASCRLAGLRVSDADVAAILGGDSPGTASKEALAYAAALDYPLPGPSTLLTAADLGRLHAVLGGADPRSAVAPSPWRGNDHLREAFDASGQATGRVFCTLPPHLIDEHLERLLVWLEFELRSGERHPVLTIGVFALGILAASPFENLNGRLSRIVIPRLLERAGYGFVAFGSVDAHIEELRDSYYDAFDQASTHFWTGEGNLAPWIDFHLEVLSRLRQRLEAKLALERDALDFPPLQRAILEAVREHGTVDAGLLLQATGANRNTLKDNLRRLVDLGALERTGQRRGTRYRLAIGGVETPGVSSRARGPRYF